MSFDSTKRLARRLRPAAALPLALLVAVASGCGGGGGTGDDGPSESAVKKKVEKGFEKIADVSSAEVRILFEISVEDETTSGCLDLSVAKAGGKQEQVAMQVYQGACRSGARGAEIAVLGPDVYVGSGDGHFMPGRLDPGVLRELTEENTNYRKLIEAATDVSEASDPGEFSEPGGGSGEGPKYEFSAPASAFSQAEDVGSTDVDFETTFDGKGYPRELVGNVEAEDAKATITVTYSKIDEIDSIDRPPKKLVRGSVRQIHSKSELEGLIEGPAAEQF